jgi:hypothetical protein
MQRIVFIPQQALGEVVVTRRFLENFSGDQVRYLARSFADPGDHTGQVYNRYFNRYFNSYNFVNMYTI